MGRKTRPDLENFELRIRRPNVAAAAPALRRLRRSRGALSLSEREVWLAIVAHVRRGAALTRSPPGN
jgi:hypothetical protein